MNRHTGNDGGLQAARDPRIQNGRKKLSAKEELWQPCVPSTAAAALARKHGSQVQSESSRDRLCRGSWLTTPAPPVGLPNDCRSDKGGSSWPLFLL